MLVCAWATAVYNLPFHFLHILGFNPVMLSSVSYNVEKTRKIGKAKVVKVLQGLSRREAALRRRLISSNKIYPEHEDFMEKISKFGIESLAILKNEFYSAN